MLFFSMLCKMMNIDKEYRIDFKVRNNLILRRIEEVGAKNIAEFCRTHALPQTEVGEILNMKKKILRDDGKFITIVYRLCDVFGCLPEDLFTEEQLYAELKTNKSHLLVGEAEAKYFLSQNSEVNLLEDVAKNDLKNQIEKSILSLTAREGRIISQRFGLGEYEEHTLSEIAQKEGVTMERIRSIEQRAISKLRHPTRSSHLHDYK